MIRLDLGDRQCLDLSGSSGLDFHLSLGQFLGTDRDPVGNADQIGILEFDARPFVPVIQDDIDPHFRRGFGRSPPPSRKGSFH